MDILAKQIADDFFTMAPEYRTKEQLAKHIEELVWFARQIPWILSFTGSVKPDDAHKKELEKIDAKLVKFFENLRNHKTV